MQVELLDKALSIQRLPDADRVLARIAVSVDERMASGLSLDRTQLDAAYSGAVRLSSAQGDTQWIRWMLSTAQRLGRPPGNAVVVQLAQLPPVLIDGALRHIEDAVTTFAERREALDADEQAALDGLLSLRTLVREHVARSTEVG